MINTVTRKERKFLITMQEAKKQEKLIKSILESDKHNVEQGYIVRSLYFDTLEDKDYQEKQAGIETRRKIRLRNYNPDDQFAVLEIKQKQGDNQKKRSLKIQKEDAIKLIKGNYSCLLKYEEQFAQECYTIMETYCYRPKAVVQYNRKAYIAKENKIRITFDSNIVASESNLNIFDKNLKLYPVFDKDKVVLEVKYNGFLLSYIKESLAEIKHSETSVSKYCLSRHISLNDIFL